MNRIHNFNAGPATLPIEVLETVQTDLLNWKKTGMSIMEVSHRSKSFIEMMEQAERDLRDLLDVPKNYCVLFLQGGASLQFSMVPMNLSSPKDIVDYVITGYWGKKAALEASLFCNVNIATDAANNDYTAIPEISTWNQSKEPVYMHFTQNETINGVEFHFVPDISDRIPIIADMSSTILSRPINVNKYGIIYAGAQKNIGPAGLTLVIIRDDLLRSTIDKKIPTLLSYKALSDAKSLINTPPTFSLYVAGLIFKHLKNVGGLSVVADINKRKSKKLYKAIDDSDFYINLINTKNRSWMNIPFSLADRQLEKTFLLEAELEGMKNLRGHRSVGGMRASIYNAISEKAVDDLISFMKYFEKHNS